MYDQDFTEIVNGNNAFTFDLYSLLKQRPGNLFFSPFSISTCLAMTFAGARGNTATQMEKVFHFPYQNVDLHVSFKDLFHVLSTRSFCELHLANSLWVKLGYDLIQDYLNAVNMNYGKAIFKVNFEARITISQINEWVEEHTQGKIKNIISTLDPITRLVLINAIYFKGNWAIKFKRNLTKDAPFMLKSGAKIDVPMMFSKDDYYYSEGPNFQVLGMFYEGRQMAMVILLPKSVDDLEEVENSLTREKMDLLFKRLKRQEVKVFLPRFVITDQFQVEEYLQSLGMTDAFVQGEADFSGITSDPEGLFISKIIHKAFVEVNEEGTEAAAATIVTMLLGASIPPPVPVFRADHPFIFFIRDLKTGNILFMGRVMNPKA